MTYTFFVHLLLFSFQHIYGELKSAAEAFLEGDDGVFVDMNKKQIKLSKILDWYQEDFGKNKEEVTVFFIYINIIIFFTIKN